MMVYLFEYSLFRPIRLKPPSLHAIIGWQFGDLLRVSADLITLGILHAVGFHVSLVESLFLSGWEGNGMKMIL